VSSYCNIELTNNDNITRLSESEQNLSRSDDNYLAVARLE